MNFVSSLTFLHRRKAQPDTMVEMELDPQEDSELDAEGEEDEEYDIAPVVPNLESDEDADAEAEAESSEEWEAQSESEEASKKCVYVLPRD